MSIQSRVRKQLTQAQRDKLLQDYRGSRLSQRQFAKQAGIGVSTLQLWLRKAARGPTLDRKAGFVELPNPLTHAPGARAYRLRLAGGIELEVASGFRLEELASLVRVLQGL